MKKNKLLAVAMSVAMCLTTLVGCGKTATTHVTEGQGNTDKYRIVCTTFPQYDWIREIIGDRADEFELTLLMDNGVDLHNYQPTAEDITKIASADLFVYVGGESDQWVTDALKEATNKEMKVINLLDTLGEQVKEEEVVEGMQEAEHSHGTTRFEDNEVQDRALSDWYGDWQSVYPYLMDGTLDEVMAHKAEEGEKTAEAYHEYYEAGYKTDVERIVIEAAGITFYKKGEATKSNYAYKGYEIYTYESGNKGVRYFFEATDGGGPKYIQFSDHEIGPTKSEHFHLYFGNESFEALSKEMDNWPTYYPAQLDGGGIVEEMIGHDAHEEVEYDEHVWLSVKNARIFVEVLSNAIQEIDSKNAPSYIENTKAYEAQLLELDTAYTGAINQSKIKTVLFGDRFPFRYLVDDYNLSYYAAFVGCSAETEASFETITFLSGKVDELGLPAILVIEGSDQKIAQTIKQNTKNKNQAILVINSLQSVTKKEIDNGFTYLKAMADNLEVLKQALN